MEFKTFFLSFYPYHIVCCLIWYRDSKILAEERKEMSRSTLPSVHTPTPTHTCTHIDSDIKFGLYLYQHTKLRCPGRHLVFYSCNIMFYTICYNILTKQIKVKLKITWSINVLFSNIHFLCKINYFIQNLSTYFFGRICICAVPTEDT